VLPFVFSRPDWPLLQRGLPLLLGMVVTFALIATLTKWRERDVVLRSRVDAGRLVVDG
jgi:hypothetical protein